MNETLNVEIFIFIIFIFQLFFTSFFNDFSAFFSIFDWKNEKLHKISRNNTWVKVEDEVEVEKKAKIIFCWFVDKQLNSHLIFIVLVILFLRILYFCWSASQRKWFFYPRRIASLQCIRFCFSSFILFCQTNKFFQRKNDGATDGRGEMRI